MDILSFKSREMEDILIWHHAEFGINSTFPASWTGILSNGLILIFVCFFPRQKLEIQGYEIYSIASTVEIIWPFLKMCGKVMSHLKWT